jgi:hypothetical protein
MKFILSAVTCLFLAVGIVALIGCTKSQIQNAEATASTVFSDLQVVSADVTKALPTVVAAAEIIAPGSTKTANLEKVASKITMSNGILQSVTLTFPPLAAPLTSTSAAVLSSVQATASALAQLAPAAAQIAESTAPGSTTAVDLAKGTAVMNLVNGGVQSITITAPAPVATPAPAAATPAQ